MRVVYLPSNSSMILHILLNYDADNTGDVTCSMFFIQMKCAWWFSVATIADSPVIWFQYLKCQMETSDGADLHKLLCIQSVSLYVWPTCMWILHWMIYFHHHTTFEVLLPLEILAHAWSQKQEFFFTNTARVCPSQNYSINIGLTLIYFAIFTFFWLTCSLSDWLLCVVF